MKTSPMMLPDPSIRQELIGLGLITVVVLCLYAETTASMIVTWARSDAYAHGFLVFPVCAWLAWRKGSSTLAVKKSPSLSGVVILAGLSSLWWLADLVGIQVLKQFLIVAMVSVSVVAILGTDIVRKYRFALAYLVFAVPFGEFLLPYLIDFTARFTVEVLNLLGIPVFRDGAYFYTPAGSFEVAKACAGLKYLIATLALTVLFSHFLFQKLNRKILFVAVAVLLSVVANAIRATAIVLLLQFTNLDISAADDHEFIGWLVYGLLAIGVVWIGMQLSDKSPASHAAPIRSDGSSPGVVLQQRTALARPVGLALMALIVGPALSMTGYLDGQASPRMFAGLPSSVGGWIGQEFVADDWYPAFAGVSQGVAGSYSRKGQQIDVVVFRYDNVGQGAELSNAANRVADESEWYLQKRRAITVSLDQERKVIFVEFLARKPGVDRLIWQSMVVNDKQLVSAMAVKLEEAAAKLSGQSLRSSAVLLSVSIPESVQAAHDALAEFVATVYPQISHCLSIDAQAPECAVGIVHGGTR